MSDDEISLEDLVAIERVTQKLWQQATKGAATDWEALSVLAKQAWRSRAGMEVTIWRKSVGSPRLRQNPVHADRSAPASVSLMFAGVIRVRFYLLVVGTMLAGMRTVAAAAEQRRGAV